MKRFRIFLLSATAATTLTITSGPAQAARVGSPAPSGSDTASSLPSLRVPDRDKELRELSKNLRLSREQRTVVGSILEERTREIRLLVDLQALSPEYTNTYAEKVTEESNSQIENVLRRKQKRKFDKELAKDREPR